MPLTTTLAQKMGSNAWDQEVNKANRARRDIASFDAEQLIRVLAIQEEQRDIEGRIRKLKGEKNQNDAYMLKNGITQSPEWEKDSDDDHDVDSGASGRGIKTNFNTGNYNANNIARLKTDILPAIVEAEKKLAKLENRFEYEALLHLKMSEAMKMFVIQATLEGHEAGLWSTKCCKLEIIFEAVTKSQSGAELDAKARSWVAQAMDEYQKQTKLKSPHMEEVMVRTHDVQERHAEARLQSSYPLKTQEMGEQSATSKHDPSSTSSSAYFRPDVKLHSKQKNELPKQKESQNLTCTFCTKKGHRRRVCPELHPTLRNSLKY